MSQSRVTMARSQQGHPEPQPEAPFTKGLQLRKVHVGAEPHLPAAAVELATPPEEGWVAQLVGTRADDAGRVHPELLNASDGEAQRGLEVPRRVSLSLYNGVSA